MTVAVRRLQSVAIASACSPGDGGRSRLCGWGCLTAARPQWVFKFWVFLCTFNTQGRSSHSLVNVKRRNECSYSSGLFWGVLHTPVGGKQRGFSSSVLLRRKRTDVCVCVHALSGARDMERRNWNTRWKKWERKVIKKVWREKGGLRVGGAGGA